MGTYSNYRLGIIRDKYPISVREKQKIIQQMFDDPDIDPQNEMTRALTNDGQTNQETKWYDFIPHLTAFSKKYPDLKFVLGLSEVNDRYKRNENFILFHRGANQYLEREQGTDDIVIGHLKTNAWYLFLSDAVILFKDKNDFLAQVNQQQYENNIIITIPFKHYDSLDDAKTGLDRNTIFLNSEVIFDHLDTLFPGFGNICAALKVTFPSDQFGLFLNAAETHIFESGLCI